MIQPASNKCLQCDAHCVRAPEARRPTLNDKRAMVSAGYKHMKLTEQLGIWSRAFGRGVFPHQMTWFLDLPGRGLLMSAKTVAGRLSVTANAQVLEIGPGSGYYSVEAARRIPDGRLTLLDVQPEMLAKSADKLKAAGMSNFVTQQADGQSLPFEDASFDAIFMVTVFGEIEGRDPFLTEARRVLRPNGVLSITEHHPDPDFEPAASVASCLEAHGFKALQQLGWRWAYTLNAIKADNADANSQSTDPNAIVR